MYATYVTIAFGQIVGGLVVCSPILIVLDGPFLLRLIAASVMALAAMANLVVSVLSPFRRPYPPPAAEVMVAALYANASWFLVGILWLGIYYAAFAAASPFQIEQSTAASYAAIPVAASLASLATFAQARACIRWAHERAFASRKVNLYWYPVLLILVLGLAAASSIWDRPWLLPLPLVAGVGLSFISRPASAPGALQTAHPESLRAIRSAFQRVGFRELRSADSTSDSDLVFASEGIGLSVSWVYAGQRSLDWRVGSKAILTGELTSAKFRDLEISPVLILIDAWADGSLYALAEGSTLTVAELSPGILTPRIVGEPPTPLLRDALYRLALDFAESAR